MHITGLLIVVVLIVAFWYSETNIWLLTGGHIVRDIHSFCDICRMYRGFNPEVHIGSRMLKSHLPALSGTTTRCGRGATRSSRRRQEHVILYIMLCIYIYIYIHRYVCIHIYIYIYTNVSISLSLYLSSLSLYMYIHTYMYTCVYK